MQNNNQTFTDYVDEKLISPADLLEIMSVVLAKGGNMRIRATGGSMLPFIRNHDVITIAPLSQSKIRLGDIVAFINSKKEKNIHLRIHRVVKLISNGTFLIRGDNSSSHPDGIVPMDQILGKVIKIERDSRIIPFGMGFERRIIAMLSKQNFLVPFLNWIRRIKRIYRKRKQS